MSQSKSRIPSPSRSQGVLITPRRHRTRRTMSLASPARSDASGRLTSVVDQYLQADKFTVSPVTRRSVLPDDTDVEMPRRASWWKRLEGSSRDVLEALDTNQMQGGLLEEYEFEVPQEKQNVQTLPENSDNDSVASIVVPQRKLFNQKKQPQHKFGEIAGSRKSLGKTLLDDQDQTIKELPRNLFRKGQARNKPVFPAALLNSTNKTINKTVEPEPNKQGRNLFGQAGMKRKNMFTDFVLSESEDESLVQHKVFGFKKDNKRISLGSRSKRMPSLTPSVTTDIDIDDWNLLPSSTMIGNGSRAMEEDSRITSDNEIEQAQAEDQDVTLTGANGEIEPEAGKLNTSNKNRKSKSLNRTRFSKSRKLDDDDIDETLTNENVEEENHSENKEIENDAEFEDLNKGCSHNKTQVSEALKEKPMENKSLSQDGIVNDHALEEDINNVDINNQTTENELSIEDKMAELHKENDGKSEEIESSLEQEIDKENSNENQDEDVDKSESSKEISNNQDEDTIEPESSKDVSNSRDEDPEELESSKQITNDDQDEEMEPMVWSDNDVEKANARDEIDAKNEENAEIGDDKEDDENDGNNQQGESDRATPVDLIPNQGQKIVESSAEEDAVQENDIVDETPNSSYNTTGRNKKKHETEVNSPETVLKDTSKDDMSFKPMGRSTSFRKSKSAIEDINSKATLIPIQESTIGSEGSRNSSTEGSGWDSHRTTRQTLRQTFGKNFTPRKSLRALVMEQTAKRQTEVKNISNANKTKNKTVEDVADHNIRDRRVSNRNLSSDQLPVPKSPVPDISTHHVADPLISQPQVSYYKSLHDINEPHISRQTISNEKSVNINQATIDSGPEISIDASYGQGMSREAFEHQNDHTVDKTKHHEKTRYNITATKDTVPVESDQVMQEELDYDPSVQDSTHDASVAEMSEQEKSESFSEKETSDQHENSIQELSDHDDDDDEEKEDSDQEVEETEQEEEAELEDVDSQQDIEQESEEEMEQDESQQIEVESEQEEDQEMSQQVIESEEEQHESEQEVEPGSERESENEPSQLNESQEESEHDISEAPEIEIDSDNEQDGQSSVLFSERIVFDIGMSDQEINYEESDRISRQITEDDVSEHVSDPDTRRIMSLSRFSEQAKDLDESIGTKKSLLLMQMQKIAQKNLEIKMKIREQVKDSLKPTTNINALSMQSKFRMRRVTKPVPRKPKSQPRQTTVAFGALPKEFQEDLKYKPPKRYQSGSAPWITKRLYNFLETKLEPKYDYRARVRAEELVQSIHSFTKLARRRPLAPQSAVDELKKEMARLNVVQTHFDFYEFFHDFMPREVRIKVNPDVVNGIPLPRNGIFGDILQRSDAV